MFIASVPEYAKDCSSHSLSGDLITGDYRSRINLLNLVSHFSVVSGVENELSVSSKAMVARCVSGYEDAYAGILSLHG